MADGGGWRRMAANGLGERRLNYSLRKTARAHIFYFGPAKRTGAASDAAGSDGNDSMFSAVGVTMSLLGITRATSCEYAHICVPQLSGSSPFLLFDSGLVFFFFSSFLHSQHKHK